MGVDDLMEIDLGEAIDRQEGGYWFDFEQVLITKDSTKTSRGEESEGDRVSDVEQRGPCRFYMKGNCVKGRTCPYRHLTTERTVVCKHWLNDLCKKGDDCEFLHQYDLSKMPECYFFSKFGECSNADCLYRHIDPEEKSSECAWYARGYCKHGPRCRHRHIQKVMCDNYMLGFCPDGPNCKFAHPKFAIPGMDENTYMGVTTSGSATPFPKPSLICRICGETGHKARDCPQYMNSLDKAGGGKRNLADVLCFKCGKMGHYADKCDLPFGVGGGFDKKKDSANAKGQSGGPPRNNYQPQQNYRPNRFGNSEDAINLSHPPPSQPSPPFPQNAGGSIPILDGSGGNQYGGSNNRFPPRASRGPDQDYRRRY